jgi:predicted nucleic acid-binding protein
MKKVLCDINIVLDVLLKREKFYRESVCIFEKIEKNEIHGFLSGISIDTIFYILRKSNKSNLESREIISKLLQIFDIAAIEQSTIEKALLLDTSDLEDAIQYQSANDECCEIIFTRNTKDFPNTSSIQVLSPADYLSS